MNDIECPYCGTEQEINHDDGYGYDEGSLNQQNCVECDKIFGYTTTLSYDYDVVATPCLNDEAEHQLKRTRHYPPEYQRMRCTVCDEEFPL